MMFELKHRCYHCRLRPDSTTDYDHFITCINSRHQKEKRIATIITKLDKLHTLPLFLNLIIHRVDNYYSNELHHDLSLTTTNPVFMDCITKQTSIGWGRFIRDRLTSYFHPVLNNYYRSNKLGRHFKSFIWYRHII